MLSWKGAALLVRGLQKRQQVVSHHHGFTPHVKNMTPVIYQVHRRRKHCRSHPRASLLGVRSTITCASNATRANHSPGDVGVVAKDDKFVDVLVLNLGPADHDDKGTYPYSIQVFGLHGLGILRASSY